MGCRAVAGAMHWMHAQDSSRQEVAVMLPLSPERSFGPETFALTIQNPDLTTNSSISAAILSGENTCEKIVSPQTQVLADFADATYSD